MVELVSFEGELNFSQAAFGCSLLAHEEYNIEYNCCSFGVLLEALAPADDSSFDHFGCL